MTPSELSLLDPEEREAWDLCQKAQDPVWLCSDRAKISTRKMANLVLALLSKVVRLRQERDDFEQRLIKRGEAAKAIEAELEAAESRISALTKELEQERSKVVVAELAAKIARETNIVFNEEKNAAGREKDSALQERDNFEQRLIKRGEAAKAIEAELEAAESERDRWKVRVGELREILRIAAVFAPHNHKPHQESNGHCPKCNAEAALKGESHG